MVVFRATHIVSIRILDQRESVISDLIHKLNTLVVGGVVNASLEHATPVAVSCDLDTISSDSIVDKLQGERKHKDDQNDAPQVPGCPQGRVCSDIFE